MKTLQSWLEEYGESHQNETNKIVHCICVPSIFFSVVGLLWSIPVPEIFLNFKLFPLNWAVIMLGLVFIYYLVLSVTLSIGMFLFGICCLSLCNYLSVKTAFPLWGICLSVFSAAWVGQFWGHKVEGKKPSFFKDIQFLMIGPAWLISFVYKQLGIKY